MSAQDDKLHEVAECVARIEERISNMPCHNHLQRLVQIDEQIRGNGKPGLAVRLDRLEQKASVRDRLLWAMVGTFITTIGALCVTYLT